MPYFFILHIRQLIVGIVIFAYASTASIQQPSVHSFQCPSTADGSYPQCECRDGLEYDKAFNTCANPSQLSIAVCPVNAVAAPAYPKCDCSNLGRDYVYNRKLNVCMHKCPQNATG